MSFSQKLVKTTPPPPPIYAPRSKWKIGIVTCGQSLSSLSLSLSLFPLLSLDIYLSLSALSLFHFLLTHTHTHYRDSYIGDKWSQITQFFSILVEQLMSLDVPSAAGWWQLVCKLAARRLCTVRPLHTNSILKENLLLITQSYLMFFFEFTYRHSFVNWYKFNNDLSILCNLFFMMMWSPNTIST